MSDKILDELLDFDAIAAAEKMTGEAIGSDSVTFGLTLDLLTSRRNMVERIMKDRNDVYDRMPYDEYIKTLENFGFKSVLSIPFVDQEGNKNKYTMLWLNDGVLLVVDSYCWSDGTLSVNSATMYYNWAPTVKDCHRYTSSGRFVLYDENDISKCVWSGSHDAREAVLYNITNFKVHGNLLSSWHTSPYMWLLHHGDNKKIEALTKDDYQKRSRMYNALNKERAAMLPKEIQDAIKYSSNT